MDYKTEHMISTKKEETVRQFAPLYQTYANQFDQIEQFKYFLDRSPIYLPSLPAPVAAKFKALASKYKTDLNKVKLIKELLTQT